MATNKDKEKEKEQELAQQGTTTPTTTDPVEQAKKEAEAILAAARDEAAKIVDGGKAEAEAALAAARDEIEAQAAAAAATPAEDPEEKVPFFLFKDNDKYKDDVFVAVNGRSFQIKRGETVMVPRYVAEILEQSMAQDQATANLIERQSDEYAAEAARLGL